MAKVVAPKKELHSKFINEQKEKIINHFNDFRELNYDIVNSFIDYIEIREKDKKLINNRL